VSSQAHVPASSSPRKEPQSKKEDNVVPIHTNKTCRRRKGIAPLILNLDTKWRRVVNSHLRPLYLRRNDPGSFWLAGPVGATAKLDTVIPGIEPRIVQSKAWTLHRLQYPRLRASINVGKRAKCLFLPGSQTSLPVRAARSQVTILTKLSRFVTPIRRSQHRRSVLSTASRFWAERSICKRSVCCQSFCFLFAYVWLSVQSVEWHGDWWMTNWRGFGRNL